METSCAYLLIIRTHLVEMGRSRRFGRKLAASLLEQLHRVRVRVAMKPEDLTNNLDRVPIPTRRLQYRKD